MTRVSEEQIGQKVIELLQAEGLRGTVLCVGLPELEAFSDELYFAHLSVDALDSSSLEKALARFQFTCAVCLFISGELPTSLLEHLAGYQPILPLVLVCRNAGYLINTLELLTGGGIVTPGFTRPSLQAQLSGWEVQAENNLCDPNSSFVESKSILSLPTLAGEALRWMGETLNRDCYVKSFVWLLTPCNHEKNATPSPAPFLSILMRTLGDRLELLEEALDSIYAQDTITDFEVLLTFPEQEEVRRNLTNIITKFPSAFQEKIQIIPVDGKSRTAPLNTLMEKARGKYISFLDDDDLLFPNHVQTLYQAVEKHGSGYIFQTFANKRRVIVAQPDQTYPYTVKATEPKYTTPFNALAQQDHNEVPNCCFAIPRQLVEQTTLRFDVQMELAEDWEFLNRAAQIFKIITLPEVTATVNVRDNGSNTVENDEMQPLWHKFINLRLEKQATKPLFLEGKYAPEISAHEREVYLLREHSRERSELLKQNSALKEEQNKLENWAKSLEAELVTIRKSLGFRIYSKIISFFEKLQERLK
ncbi:MAG: glycosyltransferase [Chloroflexi bacterium]|uniref:Glycosyltransferase n=1 Tax=Candidatus Chlorohelix allophototropha TaxID=3003348 RepID=A0A8T7M349_9CHLR|nr:glycosyltransferase [Chloroflexota bacterium]WJW67208.1 glycosyltransferase [Chloroflexota bacterium L227-S17]